MDIRNYFKIQKTKKVDNVSNKDIIGEKKINEKEKTVGNSNKPIIVETNVIEVFTDGSTFNNGQKNKMQFGGIGIYFNQKKYPSISECLYGKITNNIAELKAIITAIDFIKEQKEFDKQKTHIHIYSDSEYTINCIIKWSKTWEKNGWKKKDKKDISNKELIIKLYNYYNEYKIKFIHVKAHTSEPKDPLLYDIWYGNKIADKLATDASKKSSKEFYNLNGSNSKSKSFFPSAN